MRQMSFMIVSAASRASTPSAIHHDSLRLHTQPVNSQSQQLARPKIDRRLLAKTYPRRSSGGDDVAGLKRHELTQIAHEERGLENHLGSRAVLKAMSVDLEPQAQRRIVAHAVGRHEPRSDRSETICRLSFYPLAAALQLPGALRQIIDDTVACDAGARLCLIGVCQRMSNHDTKFHLPVHFPGSLGKHDVIVRACNGRGCFEEDDGLGGHRCTGLRHVIGIIESDTNELSHRCDAGTEARSSWHYRKTLN